METFLLVTHIILCFVIVVVILLQSGQGGGLGAGFNNAAAMGQEVFGGRGAASFLGKLTVALGALFFVTSMSLAWFSSKPQSALDLEAEADEPVQAQEDEVIEPGGEGSLDDLPEIEGADERVPQQMMDADDDDAAPGDVDFEQLEGQPDDSDIEVEFGDDTPDEVRQGLEDIDGSGEAPDSPEPAE